MSVEPSLNDIISVVGFEPYAVIQYGSRVAGYASQDSDYDYIYIVDGYKPRIRYVYRRAGDIYLSILVVDRVFFEEDIETGVHGEFVAGRLYGVYKPLYNREYVESMEFMLKKRAVLEELSLLKIKYGGFLRYMKIPLKYFLLSRLWKRIMAYPPVRYSYYKMFYGSRGAENFRLALEKFEAACREYMEEGLLSLVDGYVVDVDVSRVPSSPSEVVKYLVRGLSMYYTHGMSASVGIDVFLDELRSKLSRGGESIRIPRELENPEITLSMDRCFFTVEDLDIESIVKSIFGPGARVIAIRRKGLLSSLSLVDVDLDGGVKRLVVKKFPLYSSLLKWIWIFTWLYGYKYFEVDPTRRMFREFHGLFMLRDRGFKVPKVYGVVWPERLIIEEYIEGTRLDKYDDTEDGYLKYGYLIGRIHRELGVSIGDTKPQNVIISGGEPYIVDLEQFGLDTNLEWDLGEAMLYSFILGRRWGEVEQIVKSFLTGYLSACGSCIDVLERILSPRIIIAFAPLVPLNIIYRIRKSIDRLLLSS